ncbi:MAG TPA: transporter associated domain-containing protein [Saprospiraceae bacterium]|nr:transporter associated domain-containing protein [Saprospiraceae bacterium]HNG89057.1 transporter associated domain-containing protein [Saprospiraceae bacterium]
MVALIAGFLLYYLVLIAEQMLMAASPHDADLLRHDDSAAARRAAALLRHIRPSMSALLLARLLLKVLLVVFGVREVLQLPPIVARRLQAYEAGASFFWPTLGFALLLSLAFALAFWGLKRLSLPLGTSPTRHLFWLQRLSLFISFWKALFWPFLKKDKPQDAPASPDTPASAAALPADTPAAAEKRDDLEMLKSIVKFSDVTVKQVMQPRPKVVGVDFRISFHELLAAVQEAGFSRMPVYDEDLDNVTGILYVKDLLPCLHQSADFEWQPLIRTNVMLVPESKRVSELLQEFKREKIHLAIVVDEYGGSSGIVTMEDILEEITGDIRDEFDEEHDVRYRKLDDSTYLFEASTLLNDVCRLTGIAPGTFDAIRGNADTLAGLVLEISGDIPKKGAKVSWQDFLFTVTAADQRKITQIKMRLP